MMRKKAEWHKRLMLCATISILGPAIGRLLPMELFGRGAPVVMFGVIVLFGLAGPAYDLVIRRRVHPAYLWGITTILVSMIVTGPLAFTPWALASVAAIRGS
jgi:hypothetical protein